MRVPVGALGIWVALLLAFAPLAGGAGREAIGLEPEPFALVIRRSSAERCIAPVGGSFCGALALYPMLAWSWYARHAQQLSPFAAASR